MERAVKTVNGECTETVNGMTTEPNDGKDKEGEREIVKRSRKRKHKPPLHPRDVRCCPAPHRNGKKEKEKKKRKTVSDPSLVDGDLR